MTIRDFYTRYGAGGGKYLAIVSCFGLLLAFFFVFIRPLELENRLRAEQVAASPAVARNIQEAEARYASSLLEFARVRNAVVGAFGEFSRSGPLRSIYGDLSGLIAASGLHIITLEEKTASEEPADSFFVRARAVLRLSGGFREYVSFKKALAAYAAAVVHIDEEKIVKNKNNSLDIEVTLSVYRLEDA